MNVRGLKLIGEWNSAEVEHLHRIFRPLPRDWVEGNPHIRSLIRRGTLTGAPPEAPGHSKYEPRIAAIVVFDKGVYHDGHIDPEQFQRSVYHELGHALIRSKPNMLNDWVTQTRGDDFVDEYAKNSPEEDFCDTLSEFFIHSKKTKDVAPRKSAFIQELLDESRGEKVAMDFMNGFSDEMTKLARIGGLGKMIRALGRGGQSASGKLGVTKGLALAGAGGAAGAYAGTKRGKESGYESGTKDVMTVARRARQIGRREGVLAYHQAMMKRQKAAK